MGFELEKIKSIAIVDPPTHKTIKEFGPVLVESSSQTWATVMEPLVALARMEVADKRRLEGYWGPDQDKAFRRSKTFCSQRHRYFIFRA